MKVPRELTGQVFAADTSSRRDTKLGSWRSPLMLTSSFSKTPKHKHSGKKSNKKTKNRQESQTKQVTEARNFDSASDMYASFKPNESSSTSDYSPRSITLSRRCDNMNHHIESSSEVLQKAAKSSKKKKGKKRKRKKRGGESVGCPHTKGDDTIIYTRHSEDENFVASHGSVVSEHIMPTDEHEQNTGDPDVFIETQKFTRDGKPRSAYDKSAEWYCGTDSDKEDGAESIHSDGSSVLSYFRNKRGSNNSNHQVELSEQQNYTTSRSGLAEKSMNLSALIKSSDLSMDSKNQMGSRLNQSVIVTRPNLSATMIGFDSMESIAVSQHFFDEKKEILSSMSSRGDKEAVSKETLDGNLLVIPEGHDDDTCDENVSDDKQKLSFLDKMSTKRSVLGMMICCGTMIMLNIILLCVILL